MQTMQKFLACFLALFFGCFAASAQPALLRDINNGLASGNPRGMTTVGNTVYFSADDAVHGRELWKTTGTDASTVLVKDISINGSSNPANFCNVNGTVFFTATTPENGTELWKTDGTALGTVLVADINPGAIGSEPSKLTACGNFLYFVAKRRTGALEELKLYNSNGTAAGTKVKDITDTPITNPENLVSDGTSLFFSGFSASTGVELCRTWGENGDLMFIHINLVNQQGSASSFPRNLTMIGMALFFSADNGPHGRQIHQYIPGANLLFPVTLVVSQNVPGIEVQEMVNIGTKIFLSASSGLPNTGSELFVMGTTGNPQKINGVANVSNLTVVGDRLFFVQSPPGAAPKLNSVSSTGDDLTTPKTFDLMPNGEFSGPRNLMNVGGKLFFTAARENEGRELWKASKFSATRIQDFVAGPASANITDLCARSSEVFFACDGPDGNELRKSNGNGIVTVRNIGQAGSFPKEFVKMGNFTFFSADDGINGRSLWKTDGTELGTEMIGASGINPTELTVVTNGNISTLFFVGGGFRQIFKSNGTTAGTGKVQTQMIGGVGQNPTNLTAFQGKLFFTATNGFLNPNGVLTEDRLFKSDGTQDGTQQVTGSPLDPRNLTVAGDKLFCSATDDLNGRELWRTTVNGVPVMVKNIRAGNASSNPSNLIAIGSTLFFTANLGVNGVELFKSNGLLGNATVLSNFAAADPLMGEFTNFNGRLFFTTPSSIILGQTIIQRVNTALTGIEPVSTGSAIFGLRAAGTNLFFFQAFSQGLIRLSKITSQNNDIAKLGDFPNGNSGIAIQMIVAGFNLYFTMTVAATGNELWKSTGTVEGTVPMGDIRLGIGNSNIQSLAVCGPDLFFSANNLTNGQEPWKLANATAALGDEAGERDAISEVISVESVQVAPEIKVYPNPTTNFVNVDLPQNELTGTLSIVSASGQLVRSVQSSEGEASIQLDVQDLPKGVYLVRWVQSDDQIVVKKLIVQ